MGHSGSASAMEAELHRRSTAAVRGPAAARVFASGSCGGLVSGSSSARGAGIRRRPVAPVRSSGMIASLAGGGLVGAVSGAGLGATRQRAPGLLCLRNGKCL